MAQRSTPRPKPVSPAPKPTIRMIAERVQLSPSAVSLALRGDGGIPQQTRERVEAAARDLNYVHTPRRTRTPNDLRRLVFVMPDSGDQPVTANPFFGSILAGTEQACNLSGISLSFTVLPYDLPEQVPLAPTFYDPQLSGLLLVGAYELALIERLVAALARPLVLIDNVLPGSRFDSVMADDFGGGLIATQHLLGLGHSHIAMVIGNAKVPSFAERYRGYEAACRQGNVAPTRPLEAAWDRGAFRVMLRSLLATSPRPTALFCANDAHATMVVEVLHEFGLNVPADMSVVGFDDLSPLQMMRLPLTTVHNHPQALGHIGVQRLLARLSDPATLTQRISVGTKLVVRSSTRPV